MTPLIETYRDRRLLLGLTQAEVALSAGISRKTLSDFENGRGKITLGKLTRVLRAVGLELMAREASSRPTLDELSERYPTDEPPVKIRRARRPAKRQ